MNSLSPETAPRPWRAILVGGALGGTGDIVFAFVYYGLNYGVGPTRILRSVASGVLGAASRESGIPGAMLGLGLHFAIALGVAAVFWFASAWWRALRRHAVASGLLYGVVVYFVMNWLVVPLSAAPSRGYPPKILWPELLGHMVLVGLPVALAAARFSGGPPRAGEAAAPNSP